MRLSAAPFLFILSFYFVAPSILEAEFVCKAEVSYLWKRSDSSIPAVKASPEATPAENTAGSTAGADGAIEIHYSSFERIGLEEGPTKAALYTDIARQKANADKACRKEHESLSTCVAAKFESMQTTLQKLSFSARKELESAISTDCKSKQGICTGVKATDPKCASTVKETPTPAAEAAEKGKKKK